MISGSNYVSYVKVEANAVMPMAEGASLEENQGFEVSGAYVNWSTDGVTGKGWTNVLTMDYTPFLGMTANWVDGQPDNDKDILYIIHRDGNLNTVFSAWGNSTTYDQRNTFIGQVGAYYGWTDKDPDGCIGDKLS